MDVGRCARLAIVLGFAGPMACGDGAPRARSEPAAATTSGGEHEPATDAATSADDATSPTTSAPPEPMTLTARAPADGDGAGLSVSGRSDIPAGPTSTAQPYDRVIESAVAPLRAALGACMQPLGPGPRFYRITVRTDGALEPRAPQAYAIGSRIAACSESVVRGVTVEPPPARPVPYDIHFDVAR